ncbi:MULTISPECIES: ABC transporter substrate-binding protein [unclassified Kribbella]|uniref:ABC transporter substrate-binding protein n=1 Tax=unclassified Kribbella TaxID=2644121 RepID=UPI0033D255DD
MKKKLLVLLVVALVGVLLVLDAVVGVIGPDDSSSGEAGQRPRLTVGSANFPENELLAEIYAGALSAAGFEVSTKLNIGSREVLFPAMERSEINVVPEYTGALLNYLSKGEASATGTSEQVSKLDATLPKGLRLLKPSKAQDQETVTCTRAVAEKHGLTSLEDLAPVSGELVFGGPPELPQREGFGFKGLKDVYGVVFAKFQPLDVSGPLTVAALRDGKVDCANLFSTASAITTNGFVSLTDPRGLIQSEAVVPLITEASATPQVTQTLDAVSAQLTTDILKTLVKRVEVDKESSAAVAADFLGDNGLNAAR